MVDSLFMNLCFFLVISVVNVFIFELFYSKQRSISILKNLYKIILHERLLHEVSF